MKSIIIFTEQKDDQGYATQKWINFSADVKRDVKHLTGISIPNEYTYEIESNSEDELSLTLHLAHEHDIPHRVILLSDSVHEFSWKYKK